jgi:ATP adenylyltransferase
VEPFPLARRIEAALEAGSDRIEGFAFRHRLSSLAASASTFAVYRDLLAALALELPGGRTAPYNLLATRRWMLLVARARGACEGIEVNALGFAGALLARGEEELARIRALGPFALLHRVAVAD